MSVKSTYLLHTLVALNAVAVMWLWYPGPDDALKALAAVTLVPISWSMAWLVLGRSTVKEDRRRYRSSRRQLTFAAAILLASSARIVATRVGLIDDAEMWRRVIFVLWGAFLMMIGNSLPKVLEPLWAPNGPSVQSFRRLAGWALVLLGCAIVVLFATLPIDTAKLVGQPVVAAVCIGLVTVRAVWFLDAGDDATPRAGI